MHFDLKKRGRKAMYDMEFQLFEDQKDEEIYEKYVQGQMMTALRKIIADEEICEKFDKGQPLVVRDIDLLTGNVGRFFPESFNEVDIPETMRELYTIIDSDDRYIPNVVEEYVLAMAIEDAANEILDNGDELITDPMPDRERLSGLLVNYYSNEFGDTPEDAKGAAEERIRGIEDFSGIVENCFYDTDFMFLEDYTQEQIVMSGVDNEFGMGVMESARKRLPDGELEFIGKLLERDHFTIKIKI